MAKMLKLAMAPDGRVVYKESGRVVRGNITTKLYKNGTVGVYRNGRRIGITSKPTKAQQQRINKLASTRSKRAERKATREVIDYAGDYVSEVPNGWDGATEIKTIYDTYPVPHYDANGKFIWTDWITPLNKEQRGRINYASYLQQMTERGSLSIEEANEMWEEYLSATDDRRNEMWKEAHKRDNELGYKYLEARPSDLKKALRAMGFDFQSLKG